MIETLVVFGAGGDLTGRLLLPALAALLQDGRLGPGFVLVGAGAEDLSDDQFAEHVRRRLADHARHVGPPAREALVAAARYRRADVSDAAEVAAVLELARGDGGSRPVAVYLALPTQLMLAAVRNVTAGGLPPGSRVAVEKPFGHDAASAADLNAALAAVDGSCGPGAAYRVDHVLAMPAVEQLPTARFPGTDRRISWTGRDIEQVDVLFEETLALEGRASFYDRAGALRDVMQNHQLQMLCMLAAAPPTTGASDARGLAERRAEVMRTVRPLRPADVVAQTRRARYAGGRLADTGSADGRAVPDYAAEDGVDPARNTETFAEVVLHLDSPTWAGTRFLLRAGKALAARRRGIGVHLRPAGDGAEHEDVVWLDLDEPAAGDTVATEPLAYQRLVADLLGGTDEFAVTAVEAELAWQIFTPVLDAWAAGLVPLLTYPAGSVGP